MNINGGGQRESDILGQKKAIILRFLFGNL